MNSAEENLYNKLDITSTGFKIQDDDGSINANGDTYIYMCIRRPDPLVQKPQLATDVFAMDTGNNSSTIPAMDSGFPVDFAFVKKPASTFDWYTGARLTGSKYMTITSAAEATSTLWFFDSNTGWSTQQDTDRQSWMWKRHAGFDVVTYTGENPSSNSQSIPHNLSKTPEMMWVKKRSHTGSWNVYHKGLNGGTNPEQYSIVLNDTSAEGQYVNDFNSTAPTSTHFTIGPDNSTNQNDRTYIALLFASVDGISKVGSYVGVSSNGNATIDLGFTPRLFICKRVDSAAGWYIWDTQRGLGSSGTEKPFFLNSSAAEGNAYNYLDTTSSGVTLYGGITASFLGNDPSTHKYIYYAHA